MHQPKSTAPRLIRAAEELRRELAAARQARLTVGLVPTMGALHEGHLSLLDACRRECGLTVVSIFVNPAQFGPDEDFHRYPRDLEADLALVAGRGADLVFAPETDEMYRTGHVTYVEMGGPALPLEGEFRPGHFRGVATIVLKLFHLVEPERAYFGRKDYQQAFVIRRMVADLDLPIKIAVCPTVREPDGLAMSSRNAYLSPDERLRALAISASLRWARQMVDEGVSEVGGILGEMLNLLFEARLQVDYVAICDPETLKAFESHEEIQQRAIALVAARVGRTRLIDNEWLGVPARQDD